MEVSSKFIFASCVKVRSRVLLGVSSLRIQVVDLDLLGYRSSPGKIVQIVRFSPGNTSYISHRSSLKYLYQVEDR